MLRTTGAKIRLEFGISKSSAYPQAVNLAQQNTSYKTNAEETIHIIEFDADTESKAFFDIFRLIRGWKSASYYIDNEYVSAYKIWELFYPGIYGIKKVIDIQSVKPQLLK